MINFLKKILRSNSSSTDVQKGTPENKRLNNLLDAYAQDPSNNNNHAVMDEIVNGNSFLLLPTANSNAGNADWITTKTETTLPLTSVFDIDGLKILGAFSSEQALIDWTKKETQYTALRTQDIIELCKKHGVDRMVINSDQKNMYILERNREHITTTTVEKATKVLVGTPSNPLKKHLVEKLIENFRKVDTIEEAYQYAQSKNNEISIVLGIKMSIVSDNSRAALLNAVTNSFGNEKLDIPVDIMVLETEDWLTTVRNIQESLFYKRQ